MNHVGAGGVPTPVLEDRYEGLDDPLGHGGEEEYVPDCVPWVYCVGGRFETGAFLEGFLDKPINLLVLVFHEAFASQGRLSLIGQSLPRNNYVKGRLNLHLKTTCESTENKNM